MNRYLVATKGLMFWVLIFSSFVGFAQNPVSDFTREIEYELSTESGRLGAMKHLIDEIVFDGAIAPDDFIKMIKYQKRLYDSASDDFGIKEALEPKFALLARRLESELLNQFADLKINEGEDVVREELEKFLKQLEDVSGIERSKYLSQEQVDEIFNQLDDTIRKMDLQGVFRLISEFMN